MTLDVYPLRLRFVARDDLAFPPGAAANILRGAFGLLLRRVACLPACDDSRHCERRADCAYARIFQPAAASGPSGFADRPRPFVFRAAHLDGRNFNPGDPFHLDVHLFDTGESTAAHIVQAFAQLGHEGIGPGRRKADLVAAGSACDALADGPLRLPLDMRPRGVSRIRVRFVTPTEIKAAGGLSARPEFGVLFARVRDRIGALRAFYGAGPLDIDCKAMGERAGRVRMTRCELSTVEVLRRSSRTGKTHSIGGFVGLAEYAGELDEFLPYLEAARWTGVGRQTVWGKGEIALEEI